MMIVLHVLARSQSQILEPLNAGSLNARMIQTGRAMDMVTLAISMPLVNRMQATAVTTTRATHVAALARRTQPVLGNLLCTIVSGYSCESDLQGFAGMASGCLWLETIFVSRDVLSILGT